MIEIKNEDLKLKQVADFWNNNLCGNKFVKSDYPSKEFFDEYRNFRYKKTHHLDKYIKWRSASGKDVLEIGLGIGSDGTHWAKYANSYTGVDLTDEAVEATRMHLNLLNLQGNIVKGNAENLQFKNGSFNIVYSHGVLHHTPDILSAFHEVHRVLRDEGKFIVMLYAKGSFNYWIRIQTYFRLRLLLEIIGAEMGFEYKEKNTIWHQHYKNFRKMGWHYLSWKEFPHHCTDGPDCTIANIYSKNKVVNLLRASGFAVEDYKKAHFPLGGKFPQIERYIARLIGFHQIIWAKKK